MTAPAERVPVRHMEPRDVQRTVAPLPSTEPQSPSIDCDEPRVVADGPEGDALSSRELRVDVALVRSWQLTDIAFKDLPRGVRLTALDTAQASLSAQSRIAACCADGRGCCCQGASACGSCGMTCCSGALLPVGRIGLAPDHSISLDKLCTARLAGLNIGPADRPPATRI